MNRRSFLSILAGAGAATATSYFLPPIGGWKSDVIAQPFTMDLRNTGTEYEIAMANLNRFWAGIKEEHRIREGDLIAPSTSKRDELSIWSYNGSVLRGRFRGELKSGHILVLTEKIEA